MDALEELLQHIETTRGLSPMLKRTRCFHGLNPQVLDFLVQELRDVRASDWNCASVHSLWEHTRWVLGKRRVPSEHFEMPNALCPYYARIIAVLHPTFNGFFVMCKSAADADLGTMLEPVSKTSRPGYIRRLLWADGAALENGWRPSTPHEPKPVPRRERVARITTI